MMRKLVLGLSLPALSACAPVQATEDLWPYKAVTLGTIDGVNFYKFCDQGRLIYTAVGARDYSNSITVINDAQECK